MKRLAYSIVFATIGLASCGHPQQDMNVEESNVAGKSEQAVTHIAVLARGVTEAEFKAYIAKKGDEKHVTVVKYLGQMNLIFLRLDHKGEKRLEKMVQRKTLITSVEVNGEKRVQPILESKHNTRHEEATHIIRYNRGMGTISDFLRILERAGLGSQSQVVVFDQGNPDAKMFYISITTPEGFEFLEKLQKMDSLVVERLRLYSIPRIKPSIDPRLFP